MSVAHGYPLAWDTILMARMPRWIGLALTLPLLLRLATRVPLTPVRGSVVALHAGLFLTISALVAGLDAWAMGVVDPNVVALFGLVQRLTRAWYGNLPTVATTYAAVLLAAWGMTEARERQRRTLRAAQLEAQLQSAHLAALRAQLQPHFLYNTLNAIAALAADDQPARAVAAIEQLSELLHASLRDDGRDQISLEEEVVLAERYLALQRMRFGERLRYERRVAPDAADCPVPVLLLQPIVENAVVHGLDAGQESLTVRIGAAATTDGVEITVENDGTRAPADAPRHEGHGLGLAATRARLMTVHGDRASLTFHARPGGGAMVRIVIPHAASTPGPTRSPVAMQGAPA
jgi:LytS/YehU family sensor histidine kinase